MRHLLHKIVTKKTERLRACLLLALLIAAGGLALGGREAMPAPAAPAEAPEPGALNGLTPDMAAMTAARGPRTAAAGKRMWRLRSPWR